MTKPVAIVTGASRGVGKAVADDGKRSLRSVPLWVMRCRYRGGVSRGRG